MTQEIKDLAIKLVDDFCDWYFDCDTDKHNIGDDYFGIWGINDEFWDFSDMVRALDHKDIVTPEKLYEWYWKNVDSEQRINLSRFLMLVSDGK